MRTKASRLLARWMKQHDVNPKQIADAAGVSRPIVYGWKSGEYRPETAPRKRLQIFTGGVVKENDWLTKREIRGIRETKPFRDTKPFRETKQFLQARKSA